MHDEITIGARLRALRRWRGMTLDQLSAMTDLHKSFLSRAERGQRALDRRSHIARLASALQVSETELVGGPHLGTDHAQSHPHVHIPPLRVAMETNSFHGDAVVERARRLDELVTLMSGRVEQHRRRYDYSTVGEDLPALIDELHWHVASPADELAQRRALETLVEAYMCAAGMARSLRHPDLGHIAAMRAEEAAVLLDDETARGKAAFALIRPNANNLLRVKDMASRAADRLASHVRDDEDRQVLGMLTLNAAMAAAACLDTSGSEDWLREAAVLAGQVPDDLERNWQAFSRTNVAVWRVSVGVEVGKSGGEVAALAADVDEDLLSRHVARKTCFLADVGRGLARDSRYRREAVHWLKRSEAAGPQRFRNDAKVRETIAVMMEQERIAAQGRELRGMAARMGVPH